VESLEVGATRIEAGVPEVVAEAAGVEARGAAGGKFDMGLALRYSVANLGASVIYGLFNFALPPYLDTYHLPPWLIGLLANERSFVGAFIQPLVGRLSDRTRTPLGRRRPFFLVGVPLMSVALMVLALHPPFWLMLGIMTISAFFLSIAWDPYMALMADLFPMAQRGRVGGLIGLGTALGNIIFAVLALFLIAQSEFLVFGISTVILIVAWGYTFLTVKEPPVSREQRATEATEATRRLSAREYVRSLLRYPEAAKYTAAIFFFWMGTGGALPYITLFGQHSLGAGTAEVYYLPLAATVTMALCAVPWGIFADRTSKKLVMTVGMTLFGIIGIIGSQSVTLWQGVVTLALIGVANSAMSLINPMLADLIPKARTAEFIGIGSSVFSFAQPLGSAVAGGIVAFAEQFVGIDSAYRWTFIMAGTMTLIAALLLQTVHPHRFVDEDIEEIPTPRRQDAEDAPR
jgi:maltose/moltooligosaccharide transporter